MKERPILFSGPMVRALLAGTKTQTRRALKVQPPEWIKVWNGCDGLEHFFFDREEDDEGGRHWPDYDHGLRCHYGQPGDRLWVREAFAFTDAHEPKYPGSIEYRADNKCLAVDIGPELVDVPHGCDPRPFDGPWSPSIHMPRWACRITLEIVSVRVERLQDISEADAQAEGTPCYVCGGALNGLSEDDCHCFHRKATATDYRALWEQINGPGSWDANPWVWVVEFRVVKPGEVNQQGATR